MPSRSTLLTAGGFALVLCFYPIRTSYAAQTSCQEDVPASVQDIPAIVQTYAPRLAFAEEETQFPTMPFFTEWRAGGNPAGGDGYEWNALSAAYAELPAPGFPAVLYRIRETTGARLWRYLRRDEQALKRWREEFPNNMSDETLLVVEYYLYYLEDGGLTGHPYDREMAYVFLPTDGDRKFRVFVGEGHGPNVPPNVLVQFGSPRSVDFTVELGGHSMAPTRDLELGFTLGRDVNWHLERVWGVRDFAALLGRDFTGKYRATMTLPRSERHVLSPSVKLGTADRQAPWPGYALVPADALRCLFEALDELSDQRVPTMSRPAIVGRFDAIANLLRRQGIPGVHPGLATLPQAEADEALARMRTWNDDLPKISAGDTASIDRKLQMVWEHPNYRANPGRVFKSYLFRPATLGASITAHMTHQLDGSFNGEVGLTVPGVASLPGRLPGYLDFRIGLAGRQFPDLDLQDRSWMRVAFTLSAFYTRVFHSALTWFVGARREFPLEELPSFVDTSVDPRWFVRQGLLLKPYALLPEPPGWFPLRELYWLLGSTDYSGGIDLPFVGNGPAFAEARWELGTGCSWDVLPPTAGSAQLAVLSRFRCYLPAFLTVLLLY